MKWYKFGFTRLWDNLSLEIRNGRITRNDALDIIRSTGEEKPVKEIELFCEYVDISNKEFYEICESFRNPSIWKKDSQGKFYIPSFLIENWSWQ